MLSFFSMRVFLVLCLFFMSTFASDAYLNISKGLASEDSLVAAVSKRVGNISSLSATDKYFKKIVDKNKEFSYLMKINSKGKIISKVSGNKIYPRNYRYIGKQRWFKAVSSSEKEYYTVIKQKSSYYLFWARPLFRRVKRGSIFAGAVVAKINLSKLIKSSSADIPVMVTYGKKKIFSSAKSNSSMSGNKLLIPGMGSIIINEASGNSSVIPISETKIEKVSEKTAPDSKASSKKVISSTKSKEKSVAKPKGVKEKKLVTSTPAKPEKKSSGGAGKIILALFFLLLATGFAFLIVFLVKKSSEKQRKLMEEIDKME